MSRAWKLDQYGKPVVVGGGVQDVTSDLPLVSITAQVEVWEWVVANLPQNDSITDDIRKAARKAIIDAYPSLLSGATHEH